VSTTKQKILYFSKVFITIGLLFFLASKIDIKEVSNSISGGDKRLIILGAFTMITAWFLSAVRWQKILSSMGIKEKAMTLFGYNLIAIFYGTILPGGKLSGDLACAYRFSKKTKTETSNYFLSVIIDRMLGVAGLFLVLCLFFLFDTNYIDIFGVSKIFIGLFVFFAAIVGFSIILSQRSYMVINFFEQKISINHIKIFLSKVKEGLKKTSENKNQIWIATLFSLGSTIMSIVTLFILGKSVSLEVGIFTIAFSYLISTALIFIPVTLGGIGLREGSTVYILTALGATSEKAAATASLALILFTTYSLLGGLLEAYIRIQEKKKTYA